jgi:hypothetical protein
VRDEGISLALMECRDKNDPEGALQIDTIRLNAI